MINCSMCHTQFDNNNYCRMGQNNCTWCPTCNLEQRVASLESVTGNGRAEILSTKVDNLARAVSYLVTKINLIGRK